MILVVLAFMVLVFKRTQVMNMLSEYWDWGKFRVLYSNAQIVRSIPSTCHVDFPEPARTLIAALDLSALNPFDIFSFECAQADLASYPTRVVVGSLGVAAICAVNWLIFVVRRAAFPKDKLKILSQHMFVFLGITCKSRSTVTAIAQAQPAALEYNTWLQLKFTRLPLPSPRSPRSDLPDA